METIRLATGGSSCLCLNKKILSFGKMTMCKLDSKVLLKVNIIFHCSLSPLPFSFSVSFAQNFIYPSFLVDNENCWVCPWTNVSIPSSTTAKSLCQNVPQEPSNGFYFYIFILQISKGDNILVGFERYSVIL